MKRKTKVRIARITVPVLREMQALRNESVFRLMVQAAFVGGASGAVIGAFRLLYDLGNAWIVDWIRHGEGLSLLLTVFGALVVMALTAGQLVRREPLISGSGIIIGDDVKLDKALLMAKKNISIGNNVSISGIIISGGKVTIGNNLIMTRNKTVLEPFLTACYFL